MNVKRIVGALLAALVLILAAAVVYLGITPSTAQFRDQHGTLLANSVAVLERVELGGMKQWILMRGEDASNPVLLWLHGGPGSAQMSLAHHLDGALEEEFVVVHWDQRGAGKSNPSDFDETRMTFEQFVSDARELTRYLQERFEAERIFLLGHSWGSQLGLTLVDRYPEDYHAYISVSQVVDNVRAVEVAHDWLSREVARSGDQGSLGKLEEIGAPPYTHSEYRAFAQLVIDFGGNLDVGLWRLALIALRAPEYTIVDYVRLLGGMNRGGAPMQEEGSIPSVNYLEGVPAVDVPVYFFIGENDYNTPLALVEEYFEVIEAPHKALVVFEGAAHTPFLKAPEVFNAEVVRVKAQTLR